MAKNKEKRVFKKKEKFEKDKRSRLKIPLLAVSDNIVFSKKEAWAYYKISTVPYEFLSDDAKVDLAESTVSALAALNPNEGKKVDCHILITSTPFDVVSWSNQIDEQYMKWHPKELVPKSYDRFLNGQFDQLQQANFQRPVVYLGIKLYTRGSLDAGSFNPLEFGFHDAFKLMKDSISNIFVMPTDKLDAYEERRAHDTERELFTTLKAGNLIAKRVTANELLLTIKRRFYPAMPVPYLEIDHGHRFGTSDIVMETGGILENGYRDLHFHHMLDGKIYDGYRATLSFARFPKNLSEPSSHVPFLYKPASSGYPYTLSARFSMIPQQKVKRDLEKKKLDTDDEINNLAQSGQDANAHIQGTVNDLAELEDNIEDNKMPWVQGAYRVTIESSNEEELKSLASELKQDYANSDTTIIWTAGDQLPLFLEELPGGSLSSPSFNQMTNLAMLGASGFNLGGKVGDPVNEKLVLTERGAKNESGQ